MLKKALLSALLATSTLATAHINLNLDMIIGHGDNQRHLASAIIIDENTATSMTFDGMESLVIEFIAQTNGAIIDLNVQLFQTIENDKIALTTEPITLQMPFNQPATVSLGDPDRDMVLILIITPTQV